MKYYNSSFYIGLNTYFFNQNLFNFFKIFLTKFLFILLVSLSSVNFERIVDIYETFEYTLL